MESGHIILRVIDNGMGMTQERLIRLRSSMESDERVGFGLSAVNQRLQLQFGREYGLSVSSREGVGTTVIARIPVLKKEAPQ